MATYKVVESIPGYLTSLDARDRKNPKTTVRPATYYIHSEANGMINVSPLEGSKGDWINPDDNKVADDQVTARSGSSGSVSSVSRVSNVPTYARSTTPQLSSSGSNKRVYALNKEYIPCYIINLLTGGKIEFECEPEEISDSNSNQFDPQEIRGRSSPIQGYNNSGPRAINFSVVLHDDLCRQGILSTVNHLRSLTYPSYGGVLTPPKCLVRIGDMIHCNAIVNDIGVTWQKPYRSGVYVTAEVSINLTEVVDTPYSASDIWSKGGFL